MFLLRSAFWLTVAFVAFHPRDVDLGATATAISGQALAAGQKIVVSQLLAQPCLVTGCGTNTAPAVITSNSRLPAVAPADPGTMGRDAPFPRPRPAWLG